MIKEDNKDIALRHLRMENVRISNELVRKDERILFLEDENRCIEQETREACAAEIAFLKAELESLRDAKEVAKIATQANIDYKSIIRLIQRRQFNRNSDATRFLKGEINPDDPYFNEMGFESVIKAVLAEADGEDAWYVQRFTYTNAQVTCTEYKIGRFNVPGSDPMSSQYPESILKSNQFRTLLLRLKVCTEPQREPYP